MSLAITLLTLLVIFSQGLASSDYIKGAVDVARCRASCLDEFFPSVTLTDSSCNNNPNCNMCWQTCGYLFENYFLWVDMCNNYVICLPGCRQACDYWGGAKSAGIPGNSQLDTSLQAIDDLILFRWIRPAVASAHVVFVLRAFNPTRQEWIVLAQTVDTTCSIQKHYIDDEYRYQLVAVTQSRIVSLTDIQIDLISLAATSNTTDVANSTASPPLLGSVNESSGDTATVYSLLAVVGVISCIVSFYFMMRRLVFKHRKQLPTRVDSVRSHHSLATTASRYTDFTVSLKDIVFGDKVIDGTFGYTVSKAYCNSMPVYTKSVSVGNVPMAVSQELLLEIIKFSHLGRHPHFLSIAAVVKDNSLMLLAVERMLQCTTLTNYLRSCYKEGEVVEGTLHNFIFCGTVKIKTNLASQELLDMIQKLSCILDTLYCLDYLHTHLTTDNIIIDPATKNFKLVDVDISRDILCLEPSSKPVYFMAPEVLKGGRATVRSEIWSFGMLAWQILMLGEVPLTRFTELELYMWICSAYRPSIPPNCSTQLYNLLLSCWSMFPEQRPSFLQISEMLVEILADAESHYRLFCYRDNQHCEMNASPAAAEKVGKLKSSTSNDSPLWRSPAVLQVQPTKAAVRAFLPSASRLNAVSEGTVVASNDNQAGDDEVFDDCPCVDSPDEQALLTSGNKSLNRKQSVGSRGGSRRRKASEFAE